MMIETLQLQNFRGFPFFNVKFEPFTVLAGLNNCGKTTILRALALMCNQLQTIAEDADTALSEPRIRRPLTRYFDLSTAMIRAGIGINEKITFSDDDRIGAIALAGKFEQVRIDATVRFLSDEQRGEYSLTIDGIEANYDQPARSHLESLRSLAATDVCTFLPGFLPTMEPEEQLNFEKLTAHLKNGEYFKTLRNQLHWWFDGKRLTQQQLALARVMSQMEGLEVRAPQRGRTHSNVEIRYTEDSTDLEIAHSGAGQRTLLTIAAAVELSESPTILIDEPDAHLHPARQRELARWLSECATSERQIIVSSHGPDFIDECDLTSIRWIDRRKDEAIVPGKVHAVLVDLGAIRKSASPVLDSADTVFLVVEGVTDRKPYEALIQKCQDRDLSGKLRIVTSGGHGEFEKLPKLAKLARLFEFPAFRIAAIRDSDYHTAEAQAAFKNVDGTFLGHLPCKEVENLFILDSLALHKAMKEETERRRSLQPDKIAPAIPAPDEIDRKLDEFSAGAEIKERMQFEMLRTIAAQQETSLDDKGVLEKCSREFEQLWGSAEWRRRHVPGKEVLKLFRNWCSSEFKLNTLSHEAISKHLTPSQDVVDMFSALAAFVLEPRETASK